MATKIYKPSAWWILFLFITQSMVLLAVQRVSKILIYDPRFEMSPSTVYTGLLVVLGVALSVIMLFFLRPFVQMASSFKHVCVLLLVLTFWTIVGTWVVQTKDRVEFQEIYSGWFQEVGWWNGTEFSFKPEILSESSQRWLFQSGYRPGHPIGVTKQMPAFVKRDLFESDSVFQNIGTAFDVLSVAELTDIYHAWWYDGLLAMVMVSGWSAVASRYRTSWRKLGFVLAHCSLTVILAGSIVGDHFGATKGYTLIKEGQTRNNYLPTDRGQNMGAGVTSTDLEETDLQLSRLPLEELPFSVRLDGFKAADHKTRYKLYYAVPEREPKETKEDRARKAKGLEPLEKKEVFGRWQPTYEMGVDKTYSDESDAQTGRMSLVGSPYDAIIRRTLNNPKVASQDLFRNRSKKPKRPIIHVVYTDPASIEEHNAHLFNGGRWESLDHQAVLGFFWEDPWKKIQGFKQFLRPFVPMTGELEVRLPDSGDTMTLLFELGKEVAVPNTPYSIRVERYEPDFVLNGKSVSSRNDYPDNPAVLIQVFEEKEGVKRNVDPRGEGAWRFQKRPDDKFEVTRRTPPLMLPFQVRLSTSSHWSGYKNYFIILGETERIMLVQNGRIVGNQSIQQGKTIQFPGTTAQLTLSNLMPDAVLNINIEDQALDPGSVPTKPWVFIDLYKKGSDELYRRIPLQGSIQPRKNMSQKFDESLAFVFKPQETMPEGFRSTVTVTQDGKVVEDKTVISMNHSLSIDGYTLYQSSWGTEQRTFGGPAVTYSIFQIVRDPGVNIVYIGFVLLVIGLILMLVIHPWLRNRGAGPKAKADALSRPAPAGANGLLDMILYSIGISLLVLLASLLFSTLSGTENYNNLLRSHALFITMLCLSATAAFLYILNGFFLKTPLLGILAFWTLLAAFVTNTLYLAYGWKVSGHAPINTFHSVSTLASWAIMFAYLIAERLSKARIVGGIVVLAIAGMHLFALSTYDPEYAPVPPSLKSYWFVPHVTVYIFGYSFLSVGAMSALIYLLSPRIKTLTARNAYVFGGTTMALDQYAYRSISFGFILLTCGLFSGGWWAKGAWGDYWFWDPKETWALISWLIILLFFHLRFVRGWVGKKAMIFVVIGALAVGFTYFGMNLLPSKAHSVHIYTSD